MDLYAYMQIEKYEKEISDILEQIPRLRGIRKMSEEEPQKEDSYQLQRFNSYCGKDNVYMIHARIGGTGEFSNWGYYEGDKKVATQPWFLEKVDDDFDTTYCDIYVTTDYESGDNK